MSATNDGGPAFPSACDDGMTLRDYFAANEKLTEWDGPEAIMPTSMAELLTGSPKPDSVIELFKWEAEWRAALKYIRADAMIAAREKGSK